MQQVEVTGLFVYPVKSLKGISLNRATLTPQGIENDRRWMVVGPGGRFLTQRQLPKMALIRTSFGKDGLILDAPGQKAIEIPFSDPDGARLPVTVWKDICEAVDEGDEVSGWLSTALSRNEKLQLVRLAPGTQRPQSHPEVLGENTHINFADAAPFLVADEASLAAVNSALIEKGEAQVPMNRFRPNIVTRGLGAFNEHSVKMMKRDDLELAFAHPCERCVLTTVNQETGEKHPDMEPFRTVKALNPSPSNKEMPAFGHNTVLRSSSVEPDALSVGEHLQVVFDDAERRDFPGTPGDSSSK